MSEKIEVILLDVGNTNIKSAEVIEGIVGESRSWKTINEIHSSYASEVPLMISNTKQDIPNLDNRPLYVLRHDVPLPIKLDYKTPESLGTDRIAAAVGALELFPNQNSLVIDLGTCMTIDLMTRECIFRGGIISPGLRMRMKAMAHYTANLPDISEDWEQIQSNLIGKSTKECLLGGSFWGIIQEINGVIETLNKEFTSLNVILSGGDAHFFESYIKAHIFAGSKIVQTGLYRIWKYWKNQ